MVSFEINWNSSSNYLRYISTSVACVLKKYFHFWFPKLDCIFTTWLLHWYMWPLFKGYLRYIFTNLLSMPKREHLWNKEKCFLFHFKSSFRSLDNKILNFQIFKCHGVIKCLCMEHETHFIEKIGKKAQSDSEIWPMYVTLQNEIFYKEVLWKRWPGN